MTRALRFLRRRHSTPMTYACGLSGVVLYAIHLAGVAWR